MMRGLVFMVNDKMCCGIHIDKKFGDNLLMAKIRVEAYTNEIEKDECLPMDFTALSENKTRYTYEYEYTRINWVMPRLIVILFPSMYKKPTEKWLRQFKAFAEKQ